MLDLTEEYIENPEGYLGMGLEVEFYSEEVDYLSLLDNLGLSPYRTKVGVDGVGAPTFEIRTDVVFGENLVPMWEQVKRDFLRQIINIKHNFAEDCVFAAYHGGRNLGVHLRITGIDAPWRNLHDRAKNLCLEMPQYFPDDCKEDWFLRIKGEQIYPGSWAPGFIKMLNKGWEYKFIPSADFKFISAMVEYIINDIPIDINYEELIL
jgi:hypothetical protein